MVFTVLAALSGMEREYIRDRTLEGHESARARGKSIGGAAVTDEAMLAAALHLRGQEMSLRDIASRLVISTGKKKGQHPSPATVTRMLREHDEKTAAAVAAEDSPRAAAAVRVPGQRGQQTTLRLAAAIGVLGLLSAPADVQPDAERPGQQRLQLRDV